MHQLVHYVMIVMSEVLQITKYRSLSLECEPSECLDEKLERHVQLPVENMSTRVLLLKTALITLAVAYGSYDTV